VWGGDPVCGFMTLKGRKEKVLADGDWLGNKLPNMEAY
jgi:hypothetical protein